MAITAFDRLWLLILERLLLIEMVVLVAAGLVFVAIYIAVLWDRE